MFDKKPKKSKPRRKKLMDWPTVFMMIVAIILIGELLIFNIKEVVPSNGDLSYLEFQDLVNEEKIKSVMLIDGEDLMTVETIDGKEYSVINAGYDEFKKDLLEQGIDIRTQQKSYLTATVDILGNLPLLLVMIFITGWLMKMLVTTKSTSFEVLKNGVNITFNDIAGMTAIKEEVRFAVEILNKSKQIKKLGARPTKGLILEGPPGTGKTLIAKAIAGEANVPFICTSGSDFEEMFVGLGAARIRSLWYLAELNAPCVLFIDEIDAMGMNRNRKGAEVYSQTLNALLTKMDGLVGTEGILVIGATNRAEALDPALTRSGRFDKTIHIGIPDNKEDRKAIMEVHLRDKQLAVNFDKDKANSLMFGMSGADIENTLNEAVMCSLLDHREGIITVEDVEMASMKLRTNGVLKDGVSEADKKISAVHEAGHAVMNRLLGKEVFKVSIQAYTSGVGGITIQDVDKTDDQHLRTREDLEKDLQILLAGGVAEKLVLGKQTQGWCNDLEKVNTIVKQMYTKWGMLSTYIVKQQEDLSKKDFDVMNKYIADVLKKTENMLTTEKESIVKLADALLNKEILYKEDIEALITGVIAI